MSSNALVSTRTARRIRRGLAATALAGGLLVSLAPAGNAAVTPVTVAKSGTSVIVNGTARSDSIALNGNAGVVLVSSVTGPVKAGAGCTQLGAVVRCLGATRIQASLNAGDDAIRNSTGLPMLASGGSGVDRLSGGSRNDILIGGAGRDFAFGGAGFDRCAAEVESGCEA